MLYGGIRVTVVYEFALRKCDLRGCGVQHQKIRGGQRKLKGGQPCKAGLVVVQWVDSFK